MNSEQLIVACPAEKVFFYQVGLKCACISLFDNAIRPSLIQIRLTVVIKIGFLFLVKLVYEPKCGDMKRNSLNRTISDFQDFETLLELNGIFFSIFFICFFRQR